VVNQTGSVVSHPNLVWAAPPLRPDVIFGKDNVNLLAKNQDPRFTPRAGLEQSNERTTKQSEQLDHRATASPDSHRFASRMEFPTGTGTNPDI
jgi:hypothetical protein